jgi:hypothetical protein
MRLLHSKTLELKEFIGQDIPPYAILSHTWGDEELSFQDIQRPEAREKKGYNKIRLCCDQASQDGFEYAWVDTCCIDKRSSAELSEAINSMYKWYQQAEVCYVYLSDVVACYDPGLPDSMFRRSRWFTRGWKLQELIAPSTVIFFDTAWKEIGSKNSLGSIIFEVTMVPQEVLSGHWSPDDFSVGQRMSWASRRQTTRVEDLSYSLMGLFQINMPLLYGEGESAFQRLQEAILSRFADHTIFAWKEPTPSGRTGHGYESKLDFGLLASSPAAFTDSFDIMNYWRSSSRPIALTNRGISLQILLKPLGFHIYLGILDCRNRQTYEPHTLAIKLQGTYDLFGLAGNNQLFRTESDKIFLVETKDLEGLELKDIYISHNNFSTFIKPAFCTLYAKGLLRLSGLDVKGITVCDIFPAGFLDNDNTFDLEEPQIETPVIATLELTDENKKRFIVVLFFAVSLVLDVIYPLENQSLEEVFHSIRGERCQSLAAKSDRVSWHWSEGLSWSIRIAVRKEVISGVRTQVLDISCVDD